jgi:hypothetical protein
LRADPGQIRSDSHRRSRSSASRNPRPAVASARPSGSQPVPGRCAGSRTAHAVTLPECGSRRAAVAPAVVRLTPLRFQDAVPVARPSRRRSYGSRRYASRMRFPSRTRGAGSRTAHAVTLPGCGAVTRSWPAAPRTPRPRAPRPAR